MKKPFTTLAAAIFAFMALVHLLRAILGWDVSIGGIIIPFWFSWIAVVVLVYLAVAVWREAQA